MSNEVEIMETGGRGRPSKFTPEMRALFIESVARGLPFKYACYAVGWSFQSLCTYREKCPEFEAEIETAVALAIEKRLKIIERAADLGDVRAAMWLLATLHPEHFSRNRLELVNGNLPPPLAVLDIPAKGELAAGDAG